MVHPAPRNKPESSVSVERISFLDTGKEFEIIREGDFEGIALKPLVEDMGLDWRTQRRKINRHQTLSKGGAILTTPSDGGPQETTCLALRYLPYYLATLNPGQIKNPRVRFQVELYQEYAVDVIYDATFGPLRREAMRLKAENSLQSQELQLLREQGSSLKIQGELFANADRLSAESKVRGLLAAFSKKDISMARICRHLKDETGFDPYPIRKEIQKLGGRATLLKIITAHGHAEMALGILCRMLR